MKEIPILYSTAMIQAKLAGRKSQTRRLVKDVPSWAEKFGFDVFTPKGSISCYGNTPQGYGAKFIKCPYGQPGDLLWARETWNIFAFSRDAEKYWPYEKIPKTDPREDDESYGHSEVDYFATTKSPDDKWRPNIHMPKWAARIWDRVVSIRVERLQDIDTADALAEGIEFEWRTLTTETYFAKDYLKDDFVPDLSPVESYQSLWTKINGPGSWEANPWVWVITTENLSLTGKPQSLFEGLMDADLGRV